MTEAGASSWAKQVVGAGSFIFPSWEHGVLSYRRGSRRFYLPIVGAGGFILSSWEQEVSSSNRGSKGV